MLKNGDGIPINIHEAAMLLKIATCKGELNAMHSYCLMLKKGDGILIKKELLNILKKQLEMVMQNLLICMRLCWKMKIEFQNKKKSSKISENCNWKGFGTCDEYLWTYADERRWNSCWYGKIVLLY